MSGNGPTYKKFASAFLIMLFALVTDILSAATAPPPASRIAWNNDIDCATCHAKHAASMNDSALLANVHVKAGHDKCMNCHEPAILNASHAVISVDAEANNVVEPRKYPVTFCLKCHGAYSDLAKRTADSTVLKDIKGLVVNPHAIPQTEGHKTVRECSNCHKMHKSSYKPINYCFSCHHKRIFACGTCH